MSAAREAVDRLYRLEFGAILATLIGRVRDFDVAEEALQEAFSAALAQWESDGIPASPRAWVLRAARNKSIDRLRQRTRFTADDVEAVEDLATARDDDEAPPADDLLRLIFTCCHPALREEAQVALTLRTVCGLSTEAIARAFLVPVATMAQRLVRATHKIRAAGIPYRIPGDDEMPARIEGALAVVYLVFNEGYAQADGALSAEAIGLGRLLCALLPERPEPEGLLALMLLHEARRSARTDDAGDAVLLAAQDRARWDTEAIEEGLRRVERALRGRPLSRYAVEAAIAALHARATRAEATDWAQIAALYGVLAGLHPSPVVELNRAVAIAMCEGAAAGLERVEELGAAGEMEGYSWFHAARADLLRRLGRRAEAAEGYKRALGLAGTEGEKRFLLRRVEEMGVG